MRIGAAFETGSHACIHSRQFLLLWLGICIREESLEKFKRFVLSSYRTVSGDGDANISDELCSF